MQSNILIDFEPLRLQTGCSLQIRYKFVTSNDNTGIQFQCLTQMALRAVIFFYLQTLHLSVPCLNEIGHFTTGGVGLCHCRYPPCGFDASVTLVLN